MKDAPRPLAARTLLAALAFAATIASAAASETREFEHLASAALGRDLVYAVYRPDGCGAGDPPCPVAYLLHGVDGNHLEYLHDGRLAEILDGLIAAHRAPPMLVVMPDGGNSWYVDSGDLGGPGNYATAIGKELPAHIEAAFGARAAPGGRAIGGFSMGGFGALRLALARPFRYAASASLSGAFWAHVGPKTTMPDWSDHIFAGSFGRPFDAPRFIRQNPYWMTDGMRGAAHPPAILLVAGETDQFNALASTTTLRARFAAAGIATTLRTYPGGHDWGTWGAALPFMLEFFGAAFHPD